MQLNNIRGRHEVKRLGEKNLGMRDNWGLNNDVKDQEEAVEVQEPRRAKPPFEQPVPLQSFQPLPVPRLAFTITHFRDDIMLFFF